LDWNRKRSCIVTPGKMAYEAIYVKQDGLSSDIIFSITEQDGRYFIGTSKGLDVLLLDKSLNIKSVSNYNQRDGIFGLEFNRSA
jgi:hypothetical protein